MIANHYAIRQVTPPASEPLSLSDAKAQLRVDTTDDDTFISSLITVARQYCEKYTGRATMQATFKQVLDHFPLMPNSMYSPGNPSVPVPVVSNTWPINPAMWAIELMRSPAISISSLKYYDVDGTLQTMDPTTYTLDTVSEPPRVTTIDGTYWPNTKWMPASVEITFTAGYTSAASVPATIVHAMRLLIGHWYENREAVGRVSSELAFSVNSLLNIETVAECVPL